MLDALWLCWQDAHCPFWLLWPSLPVHTEPLLPHFLLLYAGLFTFTKLLPWVLKLHLSITSRKLQLFSHESAPPDSNRAARSIHCHLHLFVPTHHYHHCSCNLADWLCPLPPLPLASSRWLVQLRIIESFRLRKTLKTIESDHVFPLVQTNGLLVWAHSWSNELLGAPPGTSQEAPEPFLLFGEQAGISFASGFSMISKSLLFSVERETAGGESLCKQMHCYGCPSQRGGSGSDVWSFGHSY